MISNDQVVQFRELIQNAESILVVYPNQASIDTLATAASLYSVLYDQGKRVSLASPIIANNTEIHDLDKTVTEIGNQNLVVSFDYIEDAIDKVSYHIGEDNKKFYLTIKPKSGVAPLPAESVDFSYTGIDADLLILVGVKSLHDLEHIYYGYEDMYESIPLISVQSNPGRNGIINISTDGGESVSECVAQILLQADFFLKDVVATNLLRGIEETTKHFTSFSATADTFEVVSRLMRLGARRSRPQLQANTENRVVPIKNVQQNEPEQQNKLPSKKNKSKPKEQVGSLNYQPNPSAPRGG